MIDQRAVAFGERGGRQHGISGSGTPIIEMIDRNPEDTVMSGTLPVRPFGADRRVASHIVFQHDDDVRPTGFFRNKARSLMGLGQALCESFGGQVPRTMEELVTLPGVGRKTANVLLGTIHGDPAVIVDTHVKRVSARLGLTREEVPERIETDLQAVLPRRDWTFTSQALIWHGRRVCFARKPNCPECALAKHCPKIGVVF